VQLWPGHSLGKIVDCVSTINNGATSNTGAFQFSAGLNGVGAKAATPVIAYRDGKFAPAVFAFMLLPLIKGRLGGVTAGVGCCKPSTVVLVTPPTPS